MIVTWMLLDIDKYVIKSTAMFRQLEVLDSCYITGIFQREEKFGQNISITCLGCVMVHKQNSFVTKYHCI